MSPRRSGKRRAALRGGLPPSRFSAGRLAIAGLTGEQARSAVDAVFDAVAGELAGGADVVSRGKYRVTERAARQAAPAPTTGGTIQIAAELPPDRRAPCPCVCETRPVLFRPVLPQALSSVLHPPIERMQ